MYLVSLCVSVVCVCARVCEITHLQSTLTKEDLPKSVHIMARSWDCLTRETPQRHLRRNILHEEVEVFIVRVDVGCFMSVLDLAAPVISHSGRVL